MFSDDIRAGCQTVSCPSPTGSHKCLWGRSWLHISHHYSPSGWILRHKEALMYAGCKRKHHRDKKSASNSSTHLSSLTASRVIGWKVLPLAWQIKDSIPEEPFYILFCIDATPESAVLVQRIRVEIGPVSQCTRVQNQSAWSWNDFQSVFTGGSHWKTLGDTLTPEQQFLLMEHNLWGNINNGVRGRVLTSYFLQISVWVKLDCGLQRLSSVSTRRSPFILTEPL